jgi:hypothetical protein
MPEEESPEYITNSENKVMVEGFQSMCELLMVSDPTPLSVIDTIRAMHFMDTMAQQYGFVDWVDAFHKKSSNV